MNSNRAITIKNQQLDVMTLGDVLSKSGYFQDTREAAQAVVKVLAGQELGLGAIASMTGIYIVKGRVTLSANVMAAVIKNSGRYNYRVRKMSNEECEVEFFEGSESIGVSSFTMADAKNAKLAGGDNWQKFPRNMLFARALSNGAKWYCPDVFSGSTIYTPDELGAEVDAESGEVIDLGEYTPDAGFVADSDPTQWLPNPQEFQEQMVYDFKMTWDEIKDLLKDLGYNGFKSSMASDMYNAVARYIADQRTASESPFVESEPEAVAAD
jgi:hypothetical protein